MDSSVRYGRYMFIVIYLSIHCGQDGYRVFGWALKKTAIFQFVCSVSKLSKIAKTNLVE